MKKKQLLPSVIKAALLLLAITLLVAGILDNGFSDVLHKAILICFECIGIG